MTDKKQMLAKFEHNTERLMGLMPDWVNPRRNLAMIRSAIVNPAVAKCDEVSLLVACADAAEVGLPPDGRLAHIVPYGGKAQYQIDYKGYIHLMMRTGRVRDVFAAIVYEKDHFHISLGMTPDLKHSPALEGDRGDWIGAYAVAIFTDGERKFEWMTRAEIEKIRDSSPAKNSGPWKSWPEEMIKKCPIRRMAKTMAFAPELVTASSVEESRIAGRTDHMAIDASFVVEDDDDKAANLTAKLKNGNGKKKRKRRTKPLPDEEPDLQDDDIPGVTTEPEINPLLESLSDAIFAAKDEGKDTEALITKMLRRWKIDKIEDLHPDQHDLQINMLIAELEK